MPWQSASSLVVVGTMFNVVAGLVGGIHYVSYGKSKELGLPGNQWNYQLEKRDLIYDQIAKSIKK